MFANDEKRKGMDDEGGRGREKRRKGDRKRERKEGWNEGERRKAFGRG